MTIYENIQRIAKQRGLSLQTISERAGFGKNSIYDWKKTDPSISKIKQVAKILGVNVNALIDDNYIDNSDISWIDLDMPYGGKIPDELKNYYKALAMQYVKDHPEILDGKNDVR